MAMLIEIQIGNKLEKEAMTEIVETLERSLGLPMNPGATGLYVISNTIGNFAANVFWKDVIKNGPGFANPELFPWTLANGPCGFIARHFQITGPNYTYTCPLESIYIEQIIQQAEEEKKTLGLEEVWIVIIKE